MKKVIADLKKRGLTKTANIIEAELKEDQITDEILRANKPQLISFANKLSATKNPTFEKHAKEIINIIDEV